MFLRVKAETPPYTTFVCGRRIELLRVFPLGFSHRPTHYSPEASHVTIIDPGIGQPDLGPRERCGMRLEVMCVTRQRELASSFPTRG